jgi:hypothetical protein
MLLKILIIDENIRFLTKEKDNLRFYAFNSFENKQ